MQRNNPQGDHTRGTGRTSSQAIGGQPRSPEEENELQEPDNVPSFLTARELQAPDSEKSSNGDNAGEKDASASFTGSKGEPMIDDDEPPRSDRGDPQSRTGRMLKKGGDTK